MKSASATVRAEKVVGLPLPPSAGLRIGTLLSIAEEGCLRVAIEGGAELDCLWLDLNSDAGSRLVPGQQVLVAVVDGTPVVLGKIGPYRAPAEHTTPEEIRLDAAQKLTLACGKSSLEMRADGKVLIKGEDVLVRAKGTKRIRAGTVSIN